MILTIDVGLLNLAFCIMGCDNPKDISTYNIKLWDVYNTLGTEPETCAGILKNGSACGKKCGFKFTKDGRPVMSCKTHIPKGVSFSTLKQKKVKEFLLQDIVAIIVKMLNEFFVKHNETLKEVDKVLIELQPKVNNKMKLTSHVIYTKFVELFLNTKTSVRFVRASQKLKAYKGPQIACTLKGAYAKRKYLSIQYTRWFLKNSFSQNSSHWLGHFESHSKKDDLGDVFLMALNGLKSH